MPNIVERAARMRDNGGRLPVTGTKLAADVVESAEDRRFRLRHNRWKKYPSRREIELRAFGPQMPLQCKMVEAYADKYGGWDILVELSADIDRFYRDMAQRKH